MWIIFAIAAVILFGYILCQHLHDRAINFLGLDMLSIEKDGIRPVTLERLTQKTGLALLRLHRDAALLCRDQDNQEQVATLQQLSHEVINRRSGEKFECKLALQLYCKGTRFATEDEKTALQNIKKAVRELKWLRLSGTLLEVKDLFDVSVKIKINTKSP